MTRYWNYSRILATGAPAPLATVTVYQAGTLVLATIYDSLGAVALNPFTAEATGYFSFYADPQLVDIQFSGGGIVTPYTWGDVAISQSASDLVFNVENYGAVGDGVTDSTDELEACKSACAAAGGGIIWIPAGTFCFDFTASAPTFGWYFNFPCTIMGVGPEQSILKNLSATAAGVRCAGNNVNVHGLSIDQNGSSGNAYQAGGQYSDTRDVTIKNQGAGGWAFVLSGCTLSEYENINMYDCANGFLSSVTPSQYCRFFSCSVEVTTGTAVSLTSGVGHKFFGLYIEDGAAAGNMTRLINLDGCEDVDFYGLEWEMGTRVLTDAEHVLITNPKNINFWGGRANQGLGSTPSKTIFKVAGTTTRGVHWMGWYFTSTKDNLVLFEVNGAATSYGITQRNITTNLSGLNPIGVQHTTAVIDSSVEDWVDNSGSCEQVINGPSQFLKNIPGNITTTWVSPGGIVLINCTGTIAGTGAVRAFRVFSGPTGSMLMVSSNIADVPEFANNAAALLGPPALVPGHIYRITGTNAMTIVIP